MAPQNSSTPARPRTQRERSNSLPIVEALGCSTPEARLLLAEGRAAVRTRRSRSQRNRSLDHEKITTFDPRHHLDFLNGPPPKQKSVEQAGPSEATSCHTRVSSSSTESSVSTVVPQPCSSEARTEACMSPLDNYSANLADFIKAQLKNIPTYTTSNGPVSPLSPRSCPDLTFRARTPAQSPNPAKMPIVNAPRTIAIPPVRPPMLSQFSAWSSADDDDDDDTDDDASLLPEDDFTGRTAILNGGNHTPSVLEYHETSGNTSFLFPSTPYEQEGQVQLAKANFLDNRSSVPGFSPNDVSPLSSTDGYPSSSLSRPQLTSDASSSSTISYFDPKRPTSITPQMRDRIIAAVTPPINHGKTLLAISPWEGAALTSVHDVVVESQHRVHVDGMSFDMQRDFVMPSHIGTPC